MHANGVVHSSTLSACWAVYSDEHVGYQSDKFQFWIQLASHCGSDRSTADLGMFLMPVWNNVYQFPAVLSVQPGSEWELSFI